MWIIEHADKTSNLFLFVGGVALVVPAIRELADKKYWDRLDEIERRLRDEGKPAGKLSAIRERFRNERFGGYAQHRKTIAVGLLMMGLGGIFLLIDIAKSARLQGL